MYGITAASGQLGTLVIDRLLEQVPADQIVAAVRNPNRSAVLRDRGLILRQADYDHPETLKEALAGVDKLLLISGPEVGKRTPQHQAVITAAAAAKVAFIAYTSVLHADTSPLSVAPEHRATEAALVASQVPHVILRNGWYTENRLLALPTILQQGVVAGAAGNGRQSSATRLDYAEAAVTVLLGEDHAGRVYELAGDTAWTLPDLAAEISFQSGHKVAYQDMSRSAYQAVLEQAGIPEHFAELLSYADVATVESVMVDDSHTLSQLIGRPTTPLAMAVAEALARQA